MEGALEDEEMSINAIYPGSFVRTPAGKDEYTLNIASANVTLRLSFPPDYPNALPSILGSSSSGADLKRGQANHVVNVARAVLAESFRIGEPCVFDLMQEVEARLPASPETLLEDVVDIDNEDHHDEVRQSRTEALLHVNPSWVLSEVITEKKSVFVARVAAVSSRGEAQLFVEHLLATDKKAAKATHNMTAWRIRSSESGAIYQDCDDDGETAAGGRLLHLLQLMDVWNVIVIVTRWYGGVHLGPDRFRLINQTARDALVKGAFTDGRQQAAPGKKKK
ncbi:hypothetical protein FH972_023193 [Carpinus fangiana]|uniref:RWD domain-containing protein n=1 Tax=Carpinus fangiana TaxID=176857 RepID=A0A5N6KUW9_9ROSI|nr:hypothetical protein FH972_023193 [Carpinus fangiana]